MEDLVYKNPFGELVTDSLILSRLSGKRHSDLLKVIREGRKLVVGNAVFYFEENTYVDRNKHRQPKVILNRESSMLVFSLLSSEQAKSCAKLIMAFESEHENYRIPQLRTTKEAIVGMSEAIAHLSEEIIRYKNASNEHSQELHRRIEGLELKVGTIFKKAMVRRGFLSRLIRN